MGVKKINITYQELTEEYNNYLKDPSLQNTNSFLCLIVQYIIHKNFLFLLDISYPWEELDNNSNLSNSSLIVDSVPLDDGFLLQRSIPMQQILNNNITISFEEITLSQRFSYINKTFPLIPCFD